MLTRIITMEIFRIPKDLIFVRAPRVRLDFNQAGESPERPKNNLDDYGLGCLAFAWPIKPVLIAWSEPPYSTAPLISHFIAD